MECEEFTCQSTDQVTNNVQYALLTAFICDSHCQLILFIGRHNYRVNEIIWRLSFSYNVFYLILNDLVTPPRIQRLESIPPPSIRNWSTSTATVSYARLESTKYLVWLYSGNWNDKGTMNSSTAEIQARIYSWTVRSSKEKYPKTHKLLVLETECGAVC